MTNIIEDTSKRNDRHGINNPMYGRKHRDETRHKISQAQMKRYMELKKGQDKLTMDELLSNESFNAYINKIIDEQIRRLV